MCGLRFRKPPRKKVYQRNVSFPTTSGGVIVVVLGFNDEARNAMCLLNFSNRTMQRSVIFSRPSQWASSFPTWVDRTIANSRKTQATLFILFYYKNSTRVHNRRSHVLDFLILLRFKTRATLNATSVENQGQISHFLPAVKIGKGWVKCLSKFVVPIIRFNLWYTYNRGHYTVWEIRGAVIKT